VKTWLGHKFLSIGLRLLGVPQDLEEKDMDYDVPTIPSVEKDTEETDYDIAPMVPVALSAKAREMIQQGRPMPASSPIPPLPPLRGSLAERILLERERVQGRRR
jgi:hypothetical protein